MWQNNAQSEPKVRTPYQHYEFTAVEWLKRDHGDRFSEFEASFTEGFGKYPAGTDKQHQVIRNMWEKYFGKQPMPGESVGEGDGRAASEVKVDEVSRDADAGHFDLDTVF